MTEATSPGLPEPLRQAPENRQMIAVIPLRAGSRPRWAELRDAATKALEKLASERGLTVGTVRYVKRITLSPFGPIDQETLLVDKYVFEAEAVEKKR